LKPKKPNQTKKTSQTRKNQVKPVFVLTKPNQTETGWFEPVLVFLK
jgi:hypothetical protein